MKRFGDYHPLVLLIHFISVLVAMMFVNDPMIQLAAFWGGTSYLLMTQRRKALFADMRFYIPMFIFISFTNPLFSHKGTTVLFFINSNPITLESFVCGMSIAVMVIGVVMWCKAYSLVMTSDKFVYLFGKVLPKMSLVLSMTMRFIPMFIRQYKKVSKAQKSMGMFSTDSLWDKIKARTNVFIALISWSIESSIETSSSMKARGYGSTNRTNFSLFRFHIKDALMLSFCIFLMCLTLFCISYGEVEFSYYPNISPINTTPYAVIAYISFTVLSFIPFIVEVKEAFLWKYCISKI